MMTRPGEPGPPASHVHRPPSPPWVLRVVVGVGVALVAIGVYLGGLAAGVARNGDNVDRLGRRVAELCAGTPDPVACVRQPPASPTVIVNLPTSSPSSSSATSPAPSSSSRSSTTAPASPSTSTAAGRSVPPSSTPSSAPPSSTTSTSPPSSSSTSTSTTRSTILPPVTIPRLRQASSSRSTRATVAGKLAAVALVAGAALVAAEIFRRPPR